jgi:hypothetical protein
MNTPTSPGPAATTSPDGSLAALVRCHRAATAHAESLEGVARALAWGPRDPDPDPVTASAAAAIVSVFDQFVGAHRADEEDRLFPALIESMAGSDAVCLRDLVAGLAAEHAELARQWRALRAPLVALAQGRPARLDPGRARTFAASCRQHVAREDAELLPMALRLIADDVLRGLGLGLGPGAMLDSGQP